MIDEKTFERQIMESEAGSPDDSDPAFSNEEAEYYEEICGDLYEETEAECGSCEDCSGYETCMFSDRNSGSEASAGTNPEESGFFAGILYVVTVTRVADGAVIGNRRMLFSRYSFAREWLSGNGFFIGENKYYPERLRTIADGEWIHRDNRPDDFMIASADPARADSGLPFMADGVMIKASLG